MSALIAAAIVVASIAAYLFAGWRIAIRQLPQAWAIARLEWSGDGKFTRASVRQQTACMVFFWPLILAGRRVRNRMDALRNRMDALIDTGDPVALARKVAERDKRIAQLERELGIGK